MSLYTTPKCTTLIVLELDRFGLLLSSSVRWSESTFIITKAWHAKHLTYQSTLVQNPLDNHRLGGIVASFRPVRVEDQWAMNHSHVSYVRSVVFLFAEFPTEQNKQFNNCFISIHEHFYRNHCHRNGIGKLHFVSFARFFFWRNRLLSR